LAGTKKTRGDKHTAQTAFRSNPPIPPVLDTLERGKKEKTKSTAKNIQTLLRHCADFEVGLDLAPLSLV
jgi:hypothetical protein